MALHQGTTRKTDLDIESAFWTRGHSLQKSSSDVVAAAVNVPANTAR